MIAKWNYLPFYGRRHPKDLGAPQAEPFLTDLATERNVAASIPNQALSALLLGNRLALAGRHPAGHEAAASVRPVGGRANGAPWHGDSASSGTRSRASSRKANRLQLTHEGGMDPAGSLERHLVHGLLEPDQPLDRRAQGVDLGGREPGVHLAIVPAGHEEDRHLHLGPRERLGWKE